MAVTLEKTITWQEFQINKERSRKEILQAAADRVSFGYRSTCNLDLDLLPILNSWDNLPFSYTIYPSCSGTPKEHQRDSYLSSGHKENPNAYLFAHSYISHPLFEGFKDFLESYLKGKAVLTRSCVHDQEGYEWIYLHVIDIWVPEEIKQSKDLEYLDRFWANFKKNLDDFVGQHRGTRAWEFKGE